MIERLTIDIHDSKSAEIKQFLIRMGVIVQDEKPFNISAYKNKLFNVGKWAEEELRAMENAKSAFNSIKPEEW